ncbi:piggyBac transposable element-derived protein 4-like, partial [Uloborus diversus]|uniref:piggyBac transposable element-derived protein 4-like n=1 Tax=Uloborus diversus TaxID=327109 RepID=UPI00240A1630
MSKRKRPATKEEITRILFEESSDSDLSSEDDGWPKNDSFVDNAEADNHSTDEDEESDANDEDNILCRNINFSCSEIIWKEEIENNKIKLSNKILGGGPTHNLSPGASILDFFNLFFTLPMMEVVLQNTNKYAELMKASQPSKKCFQKWTPLESIDELWGFISCIFAMGMTKAPSLKHYWSEDPVLGNNFVKSTMSRDRFLQILRCFHLSNREEEKASNHPEYYMMQKLDPFMTEVRSNFCRFFTPNKNLSVDEALLKYKGRCGIIQYMPNKPAKRGIKVWMLCDSITGYVMDFEVYCGNKGRMERTENGL